MFNRVLFQRIVVATIVVTALVLFGVIALKFQSTDVPVLSARVEAGTEITEQMITNRSWPASAAITNMITDPKALVGQTAAVPIDAGTPIVLSMLGDPEAVEIIDPNLPGMTAAEQHKLKYYIPVSLVQSGGGLLVPGDYVNILRADPGNGVGEIIMQKVRILGARTSGGENYDPTKTSKSSGAPLTGVQKKGPAVAGYIIGLTPNQAAMMASIPAGQLLLTKTDLDAPNINGIPSGLEPWGATGDSGADSETPGSDTGSEPTPSALPTPIPLPSQGADDPFGESPDAQPSESAADVTTP